MSLKDIWKHIQFKLDATDLFEPSTRVQKEMEKEGWQFELRSAFNTSNMHTPVSHARIIPITPEGKDALGPDSDKNTHRQYCQARRAAAEKVYGIK